jgi:hypothetical protein
MSRPNALSQHQTSAHELLPHNTLEKAVPPILFVSVISLFCGAEGGVWRAECYPALPKPLRCESARWSSRGAPRGASAATNEPTPHTLLSTGQRSRLAVAVTDDAGGRLSHRFSPYLCHVRWTQPSAGIFAVAVLRQLRLAA